MATPTSNIKLARIVFSDDKSQHIVPITSIKYNKFDKQPISPKDKDDFINNHKYYVKYFVCSQNIEPCRKSHKHEYFYYAAAVCSLGGSVEELENSSRIRIPNFKYFSTTSDSDDINFKSSVTESLDNEAIKRCKTSALQARSNSVLQNLNRYTSVPTFTDKTVLEKTGKASLKSSCEAGGDKQVSSQTKSDRRSMSGNKSRSSRSPSRSSSRSSPSVSLKCRDRSRSRDISSSDEFSDDLHRQIVHMNKKTKPHIPPTKPQNDIRPPSPPLISAPHEYKKTKPRIPPTELQNDIRPPSPPLISAPHESPQSSREESAIHAVLESPQHPREGSPAPLIAMTPTSRHSSATASGLLSPGRTPERSRHGSRSRSRDASAAATPVRRVLPNAASPATPVRRMLPNAASPATPVRRMLHNAASPATPVRRVLHNADNAASPARRGNQRGNIARVKRLRQNLYNCIKYYQNGNPGAEDARRRYTLTVADNKVYLGEGFYIDNTKWEMIKASRKISLFLLDLVTNLWTKSELSNRAFHPNKVVNTIPDRSPIKLIEKNKFRLLISLYADHLANSKPAITVEQQIKHLLNSTYILKNKIFKLREAEINSHGRRPANPHKYWRYDAQDYTT